MRLLGASGRAEHARDARASVHVAWEGLGADVIELLGVWGASRAEPPRGDDAARGRHADGGAALNAARTHAIVHQL